MTPKGAGVNVDGDALGGMIRTRSFISVRSGARSTFRAATQAHNVTVFRAVRAGGDAPRDTSQRRLNASTALPLPIFKPVGAKPAHAQTEIRMAAWIEAAFVR
jgi:hypothetical protein